MRDRLVQWQWHHYPEGHTTRLNLILHFFSVPLFQTGLAWLFFTPVLGWPGLLGIVAMLVALAAQGRGHKGEPSAPIPFTGPMDFVSRFFVEQWVTFPRFLLSGGFIRAWRAAK